MAVGSRARRLRVPVRAARIDRRLLVQRLELNAEWVGFTLDWYRKLAADDDMLAAAGNSLLIALTASLVSTVSEPRPGWTQIAVKAGC